MNLVILNNGPDTAGCGIGLKRAFDRHAPDWKARAVCRQLTSLDYPIDIFWAHRGGGRMQGKVLDLIEAADVVHVLDHQQPLSWSALKGKVVVMHHLGTRFRRNPAEASADCQAAGATEVTDSIDLLLFPHITFLPVPADLDLMETLRAVAYRPSKRIRIAHAPTNRELKSTDVVIEVVERLAKRYPIDFDLIEGVSHMECLERKAAADIFIDQLLFGFGLNNIECWAMGIPVVSGLVDPAARRKGKRMWGQFPWADATERTLEAVVEHLITDPVWRAELGERGRRHAQQWHSQRAVVEKTLQVYERAGLREAAA